MIKVGDIVYVFKFNKKFKTKIESVHTYTDDSKLYIVDLDYGNYPYGKFGFHREDIFTKKDLRKLKLEKLI